jgi:hypothetical protein
MHARYPKPSGAARGIHIRPCDSTRISSTSPPIPRPRPVNFFICQIQAHPMTRSKPAMADLDRTTKTRDTWLSSAAQLRAPPRLPRFTFASSDVKRREPPGKTARSSAEDRGSIFARLAPAVDRDAQPAPRSRPERPRSREHEPRLTCNVRRCTVCFRGKCDVLAVLSRHISISYPLLVTVSI